MIILLTCDVDPDRSQFCGTRFDLYKERLIWSGVEKGIQTLKEIIFSIGERYSSPIKINWFLRCDEQISIIQGKTSWLLSNYVEIWKNLMKDGDAIGWHPHFFKWSGTHKCWYQEIHDTEWMFRCLSDGFKAFKDVMGVSPKMVRMGWQFHNNYSMRKMAELGLSIDVSAVPKIKLQGSIDSRGSVFMNHLDWEKTPNKPYYPSVLDYRVPPKRNGRALPILEIPLTTFPRPLLSQVMDFVPIRQKPFHLVKPRFYQKITVMNLSMDPSVFKMGAIMKMKSQFKNPSPYLAICFHPDELLLPQYLENIKVNLKLIIELTKDAGSPASFLSAFEAKTFFDSDYYENR